MSRSVFGAVCIESFSSSMDKTQKVLTENGFAEISVDCEFLWVKENLETDFATYVKTEHMTNVFVFSVWLRNVKDEFCRELCVEAFQQRSQEVKDAENIIKSLLKLFEDKFKKTECYIYVE